MQNYFNYFTEIEERFQARRGSLLMLSTLDWALIDTWREAGVPLEIVLRGIDDAFDHYDGKLARAKGRVRKINGLAWCSQAVMESAERAAEASLAGPAPNTPLTSTETPETGFEPNRIATFLRTNAAAIAAATLPSPADTIATDTASRLQTLAETLPSTNLEDLDRTLSVLEEKLVAGLFTATPEATLTALREQADRELAPYRGKMGAVQIRQVQQQFLGKRLLESHQLPRLSLFYMSLT
jgi:hypothetical protein